VAESGIPVPFELVPLWDGVPTAVGETVATATPTDAVDDDDSLAEIWRWVSCAVKGERDSDNGQSHVCVFATALKGYFRTCSGHGDW
jgi:hypothetical protein